MVPVGLDGGGDRDRIFQRLRECPLGADQGGLDLRVFLGGLHEEIVGAAAMRPMSWTRKCSIRSSR